MLEHELQIAGATSLPGLISHEIREARRHGIAVRAEVITIIATVGRRELVAAVESALAQVVDREHRVVVVTDGPCDLPTLPVPVTVVHTARNCGVVGVVRNIGLRVAQAPIAGFLDDDNTWRPDHLATSVAELERTEAPLAYASVARHQPDGTPFDEIGQAWDRRHAVRANFVDASAIVARTDGLRWSRLPRPRGTQFSEDWELVMRVSRRGAIAWTGRVTVDYALSDDLLQLLRRQAGAT